MSTRARMFIPTVMMLITTVLMLTLAGCSRADEGAQGSTGTTVTIGTMPTEDFLPLWVAEKDDLFAEHGVDAKIEIFQSAQELATALASGAVDGAMTDVPVAANLTAGGSPMKLAWVTLGATPQEGRFGIMVGPGSDVTSLDQLAGVPIGVGSGTMLEYVMDSLMSDAGIPADSIVVEELKKLPVRYQLVMEGKAAAGVFPQVMLAMGESAGATVVADDTQGTNLSQSVMAFSQEFAGTAAGATRIEDLAAVWDEAAAKLAADPEAYRDLLATKANMPEALAAAYMIDSYPDAAIPAAEVVEPVLAWMVERGHIDATLGYDGSTGELSAG